MQNALVKIWQLFDAICVIFFYRGYIIIGIKKETLKEATKTKVT
jgi:hypothetical protein